jgi:energy-coupling factor transporter ATP-binding protein EcfA2
VISFNDRVLVLGSTGSGKSELLNALFTDMHGGAQRILVDTKSEFAIPDVPVSTTVDAIDWRRPVVHYQTARNDLEEIERLFEACYARRRLVVCVHELSDVCNFSAGRTPPSFDNYVSKGRALGLGLLAGSQRPFEVPSRAKSEADHVIVFAKGFTLEQDVKAAGQAIGVDPKTFPAQLAQVRDQLGEYAFVHLDRRAGTIEAVPPLHPAARAAIMVARPVLY